MGFLIFAYRKLFLKRRIDDIDFEMMCLSQKKERITSNIGIMQQAFNSMKNQTNMFAQGAMYDSQSSIMQKYGDKNGNISAENRAAANYELQSSQMAITYQTQMANSVFEQSSQMQLTPLHAEDSQMTTRMANLESQSKMLQKELENVEKGEDNAVKNEAPKFGLS